MSLNRSIMNVIEGAHVMPSSTQGLAAYHATQAVKAALRKREALARFHEIKRVLTLFRVTVSYCSNGQVRIFRPDTKAEILIGKDLRNGRLPQ